MPIYLNIHHALKYLKRTTINVYPVSVLYDEPVLRNWTKFLVTSAELKVKSQRYELN
jgi:hypothetical protein